MRYRAIAQAFFARCLFFVHSFVAIWRCTDVLGDPKLWLLTLANVALVVETLITCIKRKGQEWKWFSPAIFIFLLASVPPIWFLELDRLDKFTTSKSLSNVTAVKESLSTIQGITIPLRLSPNLWVTVIEQMLLLFLILGRWIMPKGEISRDALSQLLFVYIGMSSDIMELFVLFEEEQVLGDIPLSYSILAVWTMSLLQFCMVLTATKNPKKSRIAVMKTVQKARTKPIHCCLKVCSTEAWSLMVSLFMQDLPFLAVRMYVMISYYLITYNTIFFTCKNILVVFLIIYRMFVVCSGTDDSNQDSIEVKEAVRAHKLDSEDGNKRRPSPDSVVSIGYKELTRNKQTMVMPSRKALKFSVPL